MPDEINTVLGGIRAIHTTAMTVPIRPFHTRKMVRAGHGPLVALDFVFVTIETESGFTGLGECVVLPILFNQPVEAICALLQNHIAPKLIGISPFALETIGTILDRTHCGGFVTAAVDTALYDLIGKALKLPVHAIIGGKTRDRIPVCAEISTSNPEGTAAEADRLIALGFGSLKLKVGGAPVEDAQCFAAVRETVGSSVELRVDANQGWAVKEAIRFARLVQDHDLALMEQPVRRADLEGMAQLVRSTDCLIAADESLLSIDDACRIVNGRAADVFNLKLGKNGGIGLCKTLAKFAQGVAIRVMVGTDFSLGPSAAAKLHFSAILSNNPLATEFSELGLFEFDSDATLFSKHSFRITAHALPVPEGPGLGLDLDTDMIAEFPYRPGS